MKTKQNKWTLVIGMLLVNLLTAVNLFAAEGIQVTEFPTSFGMISARLESSDWLIYQRVSSIRQKVTSVGTWIPTECSILTRASNSSPALRAEILTESSGSTVSLMTNIISRIQRTPLFDGTSLVQTYFEFPVKFMPQGIYWVRIFGESEFVTVGTFKGSSEPEVQFEIDGSIVEDPYFYAALDLTVGKASFSEEIPSLSIGKVRYLGEPDATYVSWPRKFVGWSLQVSRDSVTWETIKPEAPGPDMSLESRNSYLVETWATLHMFRLIQTEAFLPVLTPL